MNSRTNLLVVLLALTSLVGCVEQPPACADCPDALARGDNYFPLTEGSWWIYDTEITYLPDDIYRSVDTTRVDTVFTFDNTDYRVLTSNTYFMELVRKADDIYFKRMLSCGFGPEVPFLKEDIGQSVTFDFHDSTYVDVSLSEQRLPVFVVNGHEYFDIIRVSETYGSFTETTYYANNIGMIKKERSSDEFSMTMTIKNYEVIHQ